MRKSIVGHLVALGAVLLVAPAYSASTKTGSSGYAYYPSDASCVSRDWGKLRNVCTWQAYFDIPVETRATGTKTFSVYGKSASQSGGPTESNCAAIVYTAGGAEPEPNKWTFYHPLPASSGWLTLGSVAVATDESVVFECLLAPSVAESGTSPGYVSAVRGF